MRRRKLLGWSLAPGKTISRLLAPRVRDHFAEHLAEIRGDRQVAAFVELLVVEAGPAAVDLAALHVAAEHKHGVGVAVVGAAGAVLARGAAELRHGDERDVLRVVAQVAPEGGDAGGESREPVGELAVYAALVLMGVPAADSVKAASTPRLALSSCAICLMLLPNSDVGIIRRQAQACIAPDWRRGAS